KEYNFTAVLDDGEVHAQRDDVYSDADLATLVQVNIYTYYQSGKINTKQVYDNVNLTKNENYESFTFAADGETMTEHISRYDGTWNRDSSFTGALDDGDVHAQRSDIYNDPDCTDYQQTVLYTYYQSGKINTKEVYDNVNLTKNTNYESFTFAADGTTMTEHISYYDGAWNRDSNFTGTLGDGDVHAQRNEVYNDVNCTDYQGVNIFTYYSSGKIKKKDISGPGGWIETFWHYNDSANRPRKMLKSNGEAAEYFNTPGYKATTYWATNGNVTHWASVSDYDTSGSYRCQWYKSGSTLQRFTYYSSGYVQYKNIYSVSGSTATWVSAEGYQNAGSFPFGTWDGAKTRETTGAPSAMSIPGKPQRSDTSSLMLGEEPAVNEAADDLIPESMEHFTDKLNELKSVSTGEGVTIAILDTGIDTDKLNIDVIGGFDFASENENYTDILGHGTRTASVINEVAPEADVVAVKVFDDNNETTSSIVANAIRYAVDMGARVLSMPFTLFPISDQLEAAIDYAVDMGAILIAAAGNEGTEILEGSLAADDNVITVGSADPDGSFSAWSNYGNELDLAAPWDVITADGENEAGTSFSAALVSGITALMLAENPEMTREDVIEKLADLMSDFDSTVSASEVDEQMSSGVDQKVLSDVVGMQKAIAMSRRQASDARFSRKHPTVQETMGQYSLIFPLKGRK
ncbi:MAG: S8/S53 family peptidase, partial [Candidatus Omnitrophica bacterium]|nr:S8/S53 family peptidase [Candidatus Omnitrophota bacterium]